ncbi:hypothetical protein HanPSC8_Chr07g0299291 [Helianthus annuus]|nr:hypothetical protein HanPSC8_Chr07g0299291 [Helianthus annuus]
METKTDDYCRFCRPLIQHLGLQEGGMDAIKLDRGCTIKDFSCKTHC